MNFIGTGTLAHVPVGKRHLGELESADIFEETVRRTRATNLDQLDRERCEEFGNNGRGDRLAIIALDLQCELRMTFSGSL